MMGGDVTDERTGQGLVVHGAPAGRRGRLDSSAKREALLMRLSRGFRAALFEVQRFRCSQSAESLLSIHRGAYFLDGQFSIGKSKGTSELFTRIVLSFRSYEITSKPFKRPPMRVDAPPYAHHPLAPLNAPAATARAAGLILKRVWQKQRPRPSPALVQESFFPT